MVTLRGLSWIIKNVANPWNAFLLHLVNYPSKPKIKLHGCPPFVADRTIFRNVRDCMMYGWKLMGKFGNHIIVEREGIKIRRC